MDKGQVQRKVPLRTATPVLHFSTFHHPHIIHIHPSTSTHLLQYADEQLIDIVLYAAGRLNKFGIA